MCVCVYIYICVYHDVTGRQMCPVKKDFRERGTTLTRLKFVHESTHNTLAIMCI